jgi:pimeloyl-ACP methyl ester carboxylesterase
MHLSGKPGTNKRRLNLLSALLVALTVRGMAASPEGLSKETASPEIVSPGSTSKENALKEGASKDVPGLANVPPTKVPQRDQYITIEGAKIHYVEAGSGQAVVLLHGNDGTLQDFTMSLFDQLATKYRTVTFDRPGHGESESPKHADVTPATQGRILHKLMKELGITHPLLVAHSWSGALALSYALEYPDDLCGIVMLSGMAYETKEGAAKPSYYAVKVPLFGTAVAILYKFTGHKDVEKQLRQAFTPDSPPQPYMDQFVSSLFRVSQLKAAARDEIALNPSLKGMSPNYGKIAVPVVIICGDQDKTVAPAQHSYPLHKAIPHSHLIVVKDAGHELQFTRPQEVINAIDLAVEKAAAWQKSKPAPASVKDAAAR